MILWFIFNAGFRAIGWTIEIELKKLLLFWNYSLMPSHNYFQFIRAASTSGLDSVTILQNLAIISQNLILFGNHELKKAFLRIWVSHESPKLPMSSHPTSPDFWIESSSSKNVQTRHSAIPNLLNRVNPTTILPQLRVVSSAVGLCQF